MKKPLYPLLLLSVIIPIMSSHPALPDPPRSPRPEFHPKCEEVNRTQPLNYLGTNLTINSEDPEGLLLCPGDAFGDLNETYVKIQDCHLAMYHKDKIIWSRGRKDFGIVRGDCSDYDYCLCVFYLERDGTLVLDQEETEPPMPEPPYFQMYTGVTREYFGPTKSELRVKDQQVQIIRTFRDGTQRLFYLDENHQIFTEDMGEPIKKADKFIIKSHSDPDKIILRRNEYVGDLNGTHLILQINCQLELVNKNKIIWSFRPYFGSRFPCTLDVAQDNTIEISRRWLNQTLGGLHNRQSIIESEANLKVIESKITLGDSEPIITQTLKNGSELIFYGGRLNRQLTHIAQKNLIAQSPRKHESKESDSSKNISVSRMERMEYLGNLTGVHLILEQNCSLILANGNEKLWELETEPRNSNDAVIGCSVELETHGRISLIKYPRGSHRMLESFDSSTGVELTLENDQIVVKRERKDQDYPEVFYAGPYTNGTFFQLIAQNSITITNHDYYYYEILPKMGYLGDLNGVYILLDKNCNLVMYNKTQVLWESGASLDHTSKSCGLGLHDDWQVEISAGRSSTWRETIWSAFDVPPHVNFGQLLKAEFSIIDDELWLIYTFRDGTQAKESSTARHGKHLFFKNYRNQIQEKSKDGACHMEMVKGTNHFTNNLAESLPPFHSDLDKIIFCKERNTTQSVNYLEANLTSNSNDPTDILLCPGDTFGDLNETYVAVKNCDLIMYSKNKAIWTPKIDTASMPYWMRMSEKYSCAASLERNGDLVLYQERRIFFPNGPSTATVLWQAQTNLNPVKTDLRLQDQQIQIIHTLRNGTQKLFYADSNHQEFTEDMGEPIKVADQFIIKNHSDENKIILQRNEYIGDLNGTHLILQTNCNLQLVNKNKTIWSFIPPFRHQMNCTLNVAEDNTIQISSPLTGSRERIMKSKKSLKVVESHITFEDDQPRIIQILENGSELIFYGAGLNSGLKIKRELKQIAQKIIAIRIDEYGNSDSDSYYNSDSDEDSDEDSNNDDDLSVIKRMNYIGNLTGLHLLLEQNCSLILANGHQKLWELRSEPQKYRNPVMECSVRLFPNGKIRLERDVRKARWIQPLLNRPLSSYRNPEAIGVELTLENDQVIVKKEFDNQGSKIYYAGPKTDGTFFQFIAKRSVIVDLNDDDYWYEILPKLGYIGDLNGIYVILDRNCNLILYNKTQILWESGNSQEDAWNGCTLQLKFKKQGDVELLVKRPSDIRKRTWSALDFSKPFSYSKQVLRVELSITDGELWLIYSFSDRSVHKYRAIRGKNHFTLMSKQHDLLFSGEL